MEKESHHVPMWDGAAKGWRRYTREVCWYVRSTAISKRRCCALKLIGRLTGPARLLAMSWGHMDFDNKGGTKELLRRLAASPVDRQVNIEVQQSARPYFCFGNGQWGRALYRVVITSNVSGYPQRFKLFALPNPPGLHHPDFDKNTLVPILVGMDHLGGDTGMAIDFPTGMAMDSFKTDFQAYQLPSNKKGHYLLDIVEYLTRGRECLEGHATINITTDELPETAKLHTLEFRPVDYYDMSVTDSQLDANSCTQAIQRLKYLHRHVQHRRSTFNDLSNMTFGLVNDYPNSNLSSSPSGHGVLQGQADSRTGCLSDRSGEDQHLPQGKIHVIGPRENDEDGSSGPTVKSTSIAMPTRGSSGGQQSQSLEHMQSVRFENSIYGYPSSGEHLSTHQSGQSGDDHSHVERDHLELTQGRTPTLALCKAVQDFRSIPRSDERYLGEHQDSTFAKQDSNVHRPQQVIPPRRAARDPTPESQDLLVNNKDFDLDASTWRYDLYKKETWDNMKILRKRTKPRKIWLSLPCTKYCQWTFINYATDERKELLKGYQRRERRMLWNMNEFIKDTLEDDPFCEIYLNGLILVEVDFKSSNDLLQDCGDQDPVRDLYALPVMAGEPVVEATGDEQPSQEELQRWQSKIAQYHRAAGHPTNRNLARLVKNAGQPEWKVQEVLKYQCPACISLKPGGTSSGAIPPASTSPMYKAWQAVAMDTAEWLIPGTKRKLKFLLTIDLATKLRVAQIIKEYDIMTMEAESSEDIIKGFSEKWLSILPKPDLVVLDSSKTFTSEKLRDFLTNINVQVHITAETEPWANGVWRKLQSSDQHKGVRGGHKKSGRPQWIEPGRVIFQEVLPHQPEGDHRRHILWVLIGNRVMRCSVHSVRLCTEPERLHHDLTTDEDPTSWKTLADILPKREFTDMVDQAPSPEQLELPDLPPEPDDSTLIPICRAHSKQTYGPQDLRRIHRSSPLGVRPDPHRPHHFDRPQASGASGSSSHVRVPGVSQDEDYEPTSAPASPNLFDGGDDDLDRQLGINDYEPTSISRPAATPDSKKPRLDYDLKWVKQLEQGAEEEAQAMDFMTVLQERDECLLFNIDLEFESNRQLKMFERNPVSYLVKKINSSEVNLKRLTPDELDLFKRAKDKEVDSFIKNEAVRRCLDSKEVAEAYSSNRILKARWVLTWKSIPPDEKEETVEDRQQNPKTTVNQQATKKAKARIVLLGYQRPSLLDHISTIDTPNGFKIVVDQDAYVESLPEHWNQLVFITMGDQAHANRPNGDSTGGIVSMAAGPESINGAVCPMMLIAWRSWKLRRKAIASNDAEIQAVLEGEDQNFRIRLLWTGIHGGSFLRGDPREDLVSATEKQVVQIKGIICTDSRGGYDAVEVNHHFWVYQTFGLPSRLSSSGRIFDELDPNSGGLLQTMIWLML
eukprot:symbB.v1.2.024754.t1/scaffold2367.1/size81165/7